MAHNAVIWSVKATHNCAVVSSDSKWQQWLWKQPRISHSHYCCWETYKRNDCFTFNIFYFGFTTSKRLCFTAWIDISHILQTMAKRKKKERLKWRVWYKRNSLRISGACGMKECRTEPKNKNEWEGDWKANVRFTDSFLFYKRSIINLAKLKICLSSLVLL